VLNVCYTYSWCSLNRQLPRRRHIGLLPPLLHPVQFQSAGAVVAAAGATTGQPMQGRGRSDVWGNIKIHEAAGGVVLYGDRATTIPKVVTLVSEKSC
jgi:hypothetical protein